ncbi:ribosome biogenesis protein tsr1 [Lithohypha guttulata]|uniref:Ribosome biogenesis protein tsr1 n=1 Tax=Lithohypha guttulata TaxID=1690604 RepID=A0AAN7T1I5_9EURO|nr:ribosome biogenesis protein tsr1 [Lithohypha guttulata]
MSISAQPVHHHRNTTKVDHKQFKSRHATKSALKDAAKGKVEREERGKRRTPHQQVMSKLVRRNQAKQSRIHHKIKKEQETDIFKGAEGAPKHVAVVPLSKEVDVRRAINEMNAGVDIEPSMQEEGIVRTRIERYGRNVLFMPATMNMLNALDVCKLADFVLFVLAAAEDLHTEAENLLRVIEGQGVTNALFVVQNAKETVPDNKLSKRLAELKIQTGHYFPDPDKLVVLDNKNDCALLMRKICTQSTKGIRWRDARSWMLIENTQWSVPKASTETANVILSGLTRGKSLNPDRLVHVPGWGEYQVAKITQIPLKPLKRKADEMTMDQDRKGTLPSTEQDDLTELAPEQAMTNTIASSIDHTEQKGVLLDDHHYFSDDNSHIPQQPKKLPPGTSKYQSAWYLDDVSDSEDEAMDEDMPIDDANEDAASEQPEDGAVAREDAMTDIPATEYPDTEMHVDQDEAEEARQLAEFRASRKKEAEEDLEFPDEIELHPDVLARERLAKYRGLKSLRTSEWNTEADAPYEPADYKRLLQVPDYKKSYSAVMKESLAGGIPAGSRVEIELQNVSTSLQSTTPSSLFSLLKHEHKQAVINLNVSLSSSLTAPIKSKEEIIVQIGHRRLAINPIFSAGGVTPNDVHKFDRFLHPGRTAVATFVGPLTWGSVPCLVFRKSEQGDLEMIGTATTLPPSSSRIVTKRVILTGNPFKIHKKLVTIRYMFFNREDVEWFKALPLWTKRGRQGFIKEALGTHGYFKATFDGAGKTFEES